MFDFRATAALWQNFALLTAKHGTNLLQEESLA
jgi:hypothetical protein